VTCHIILLEVIIRRWVMVVIKEWTVTLLFITTHAHFLLALMLNDAQLVLWAVWKVWKLIWKLNVPHTISSSPST